MGFIVLIHLLCILKRRVTINNKIRHPTTRTLVLILILVRPCGWHTSSTFYLFTDRRTFNTQNLIPCIMWYDLVERLLSFVSKPHKSRATLKWIHFCPEAEKQGFPLQILNCTVSRQGQLFPASSSSHSPSFLSLMNDSLFAFWSHIHAYSIIMGFYFMVSLLYGMLALVIMFIIDVVTRGYRDWKAQENAEWKHVRKGCFFPLWRLFCVSLLNLLSTACFWLDWWKGFTKVFHALIKFAQVSLE